MIPYRRRCDIIASLGSTSLHHFVKKTTSCPHIYPSKMSKTIAVASHPPHQRSNVTATVSCPLQQKVRSNCCHILPTAAKLKSCLYFSCSGLDLVLHVAWSFGIQVVVFFCSGISDFVTIRCFCRVLISDPSKVLSILFVPMLIL